MLIFDSFANQQSAENFVKAVADEYGLTAEIFDNQEQSDAVDPFPFKLEAPIVLVQRSHHSTENGVIKLAKIHFGDFAGT